MRILIVAAYFPPQNGIGGLRPYSWAKWWSRAGHDVTVLTTYKKIDSSAMFMDVSGFTVIDLPVTRYHSGVSVRDNRNKASNPKNGNSVKKDIFSVKLLKKLLVAFSLKTGCFGTIRFPDFHDFWAKRALKKIIAGPFDLLITTGGPYSVHRIGLALKKMKPEIKWVLDWRDLWTKNHSYRGFFIFWPYEKALEKAFHRSADLITTVSEPFADSLRQMTKTRVEVVYNGFDVDDYCKITENPRKNNRIFSIVYTGIVLKDFQDVTPLFKAVSNAVKMGLIHKDDLIIQFAGANCDYTDLAQEYNIQDYFIYLGYLPRAVALQLQYDADALLLLEHSNTKVRGVLLGKIFEYMFIGREIITLCNFGVSDSGRMIQETRSGICLGNDVEKVEKYLIDRIIKKLPPSQEKDTDKINSFNRKKQAEKLLEYVESIG
jgi:glycosyltransferase involved in cell wall biosynthesis